MYAKQVQKVRRASPFLVPKGNWKPEMTGKYIKSFNAQGTKGFPIEIITQGTLLNFDF